MAMRELGWSRCVISLGAWPSHSRHANRGGLPALELRPARRGRRARVVWRPGRRLTGRLPLRSLYDHREEVWTRALTEQARSGLDMNELRVAAPGAGVR